MKNNFLQRTVTGLLFVAVLVGCILYGPLSFTIMFAVVCALSVHEFARLVNRGGQVSVNKLMVTLSGVYLFLAMFAFRTYAAGAEVFLPYVGLLLYLMITELYLKKENPIGNWACSMLSQLYVALPFALLGMLAFREEAATGRVVYEPVLPLSVFVFIWLSDTGAYCVGSLVGKRRLFERISPKKSWEGSVGGGTFALAASLVFARFFPFMPLGLWMGLAVVVVVFGTWGDLTESLMKRQLGIKDSGHILPGHGGMLDRFDSALMAVPAAALYLYAVDLF